MALINCAECGAQISDKAPACVKCGAPVTASVTATTPVGERGECPICGQSCPITSVKCISCETEFGLGVQIVPLGTYRHFAESPPSAHQQVFKAAKSRGIYIILGLFLGGLGVHNFYAGRLGIGLAQLLTVLILGWFVVGFVIVGVWVLIELFTVTKDGAGDAFA